MDRTNNIKEFTNGEVTVLNIKNSPINMYKR